MERSYELTDTRFYGLNYNIPSLHGFNEIRRSRLAAEIDQGHRAVHRGMVWGGDDLEKADAGNCADKFSAFGIWRELDALMQSPLVRR